jgi:hypothetical protein
MTPGTSSLNAAGYESEEGGAMHNENLEMAQVASLVLALAAGESAGDTRVEALALIDAARSINWATE